MNQELNFEEFRCWLTGFLTKNRGALPDEQDWEEIKKILGLVKPEKEVIHNMGESPQSFYIPTYPEPSWNFEPLSIEDIEEIEQPTTQKREVRGNVVSLFSGGDAQAAELQAELREIIKIMEEEDGKKEGS